jgi:N-formylglutamate deformylase
METFRFRAGGSPLLVSMPHTGTYLPPDLAARLTPPARAVPDTDWHLEPLYDFLPALDASLLVATHSRYVVDLNRPPDGANLYPGQDTTGLVPLDTFHKEALYRPGDEPGDPEIRERVKRFWNPYHERLAGALADIRQRHGYALLWDAHSIFSRLPRFFAGTLTDFNLGTVGGKSCAAGIGEALLAAVDGYTAVLDGRFKGGYITRRYGHPAGGVHAVQLELSEATYMDEFAPYRLRDDLAAALRPRLRRLVEEFVRRAPRPRKD